MCKQEAGLPWARHIAEKENWPGVAKWLESWQTAGVNGVGWSLGTLVGVAFADYSKWYQQVRNTGLSDVQRLVGKHHLKALQKIDVHKQPYVGTILGASQDSSSNLGTSEPGFQRSAFKEYSV